jgi:2-iminobutanoate/2-iminopropanoate deaminase
LESGKTKKSFRVSERMPAGNVAGVKAGGLLWLSAIRGDGDGVQAQLRAALEDLKKILGSEGSGLGDVVKATVYMQDIGERAAFHEVWMEYFGAGETAPARVMVEVANASLRAGGDSRFVLDIVALAPD